MRGVFFPILTLLLIAAALFFFLEGLQYLAQRDYAAALIVSGIGISVLFVGKETARLSLVQK